LSEITIPSSVTSIGKRAFMYCGSLKSIAIPSSVTSIGESAFDGCSSLTSITIPSSVTSIGEWAFCDCSGLRAFYCKATMPPTLGQNAFFRDNDITIYVPTTSVSAYKSTTNWKSYSSKIQGYSF
jgi:hypothetical protein